MEALGVFFVDDGSDSGPGVVLAGADGFGECLGGKGGGFCAPHLLSGLPYTKWCQRVKCPRAF